MALQLRRGTNQQRLGLTPVEGEMIYVTDNVLVTISVTGIDTGTETLSTTTPHGLSVDQQVKYTGATLNGLTKDQVYFVKTAPTITDFTLSTTLGGSTLNITGSYTVPLVFAKTPCDGSGTPLGYDVSPLWAGDGTTVGGNPAGAILLDELRDVVITAPATEGEFLWYNGTSWVNENETTVDTTEKTLKLTRRSTTAGESYENEIALRLNDRLTDSHSYINDEGGPSLRYERSSGTQYTKTYVSGGAIGAYTVTLNNVTNLVVGDRLTGTGLTNENPGALITNISGNQLTLDTAFTEQAAGSYTVGAPVGFGHVSFEWFGTTNDHKFKVAASTDNFLENPANTYPGTKVLIESTRDYTSINEGTLFVDATNDRIGINDAGPDYDITVFKTAAPNFALINGDREFVLTNSATTDLLSFSLGGNNVLQFDATSGYQWFNSGRLGVNTNTPSYNLDINGTANIETSLTVPIITTLVGDNLDISAYSGRDVTISTTLAADPVTLVRNSATTASAVRALTLRANSTGTPAVGFGGQIEWEVDTPAGLKSAGYMEVASTNVTAGDETFTMRFGVMNDNTTATALMILDSLGNLQIDGDLTVSGTNINTGADDTIISIDRTTATTPASFNTALILKASTSGTPVVGYGTAMRFVGQTTTTENIVVNNNTILDNGVGQNNTSLFKLPLTNGTNDQVLTITNDTTNPILTEWKAPINDYVKYNTNSYKLKRVVSSIEYDINKLSLNASIGLNDLEQFQLPFNTSSTTVGSGTYFLTIANNTKNSFWTVPFANVAYDGSSYVLSSETAGAGILPITNLQLTTIGQLNEKFQLPFNTSSTTPGSGTYFLTISNNTKNSFWAVPFANVAYDGSSYKFSTNNPSIVDITNIALDGQIGKTNQLFTLPSNTATAPSTTASTSSVLTLSDSITRTTTWTSIPNITSYTNYNATTNILSLINPIGTSTSITALVLPSIGASILQKFALPTNTSTASTGTVLTLGASNLTSWSSIPTITNYLNYDSTNKTLISNVSGTPTTVIDLVMSGSIGLSTPQKFILPSNSSTAPLNSFLSLTNTSTKTTSWVSIPSAITNYLNYDSTNKTLISNVSGTPTTVSDLVANTTIGKSLIEKFVLPSNSSSAPLNSFL